jgi:PAS domain S-box-containing protein
MENEASKVLLVEDNPGDARLIREMLKEAAAAQFELVHVVRLDEALKLLGEASFDVLLLDLTLPDSQGLDTFFRVYRQAPEVPIVVLTGLADEVIGVESVKGGAQDYLVKGQADSNLLARALRYAMERKRAEERLQESKRQYRVLFDNTIDGVVVIDAETMKIVLANQAAVKMYGFDSLEGVVEVNPLDFVPSEDRERVVKIITEDLFENDVRQIREIRTLTKDGREIWIEAFSIRTEYKGRLAGLVSIRDITERKRAEEALRESEKRFSDITEDALSWIWETDANRRITYASAVIEKILGYAPDEVVGKNYYELFPPEDWEEMAKASSETYARKQPFREFTHRGLHKNGKGVWLSVSATPMLNEKGDLLGYRGATTDITERKRAEEALRESERRYRLLAENVTDVIYVMDMNLQPSYMSPSVTRLLGYSVEEAMSHSMEESLTPASLLVTRKAFARALKTKEMGREGSYPEGTLELEMKCKDGSTVWVETTVSFLRDPDDRPVGLLGVIRDITERKRAEEERRGLEQKAQLMSRLASVGEMASGIAHEINNPLTSVIGFAQLLTQKDLPQDIREDLKIINEGAQRVASIIKRLLTFARQYKPERAYININDIIATTLDLRAYETETGNIKVITQLDPDLPGTIADGGQLQQVFLNIIINAETEMKLAHSKGNLFVKTETIDNTIRISFKDDGPGIAKENLERIFDPFFTTREVGKGTGLGLSICHGIMTEHGGRIYAKSKLGKGAAFIVELPIVTKPEQLKLAEPAADESEGVDGVSILVVDDEPAILQFLTSVLTEEGHQVETVDNADDALARLKSKSYSLILLDIKLPGVSGIELYKRIQKIAKSLARRVVFITGDVIGADTKDFLARTKALYITKPFDTEQLKKDINHILTHGVTEVSRSEIFLEPLTSPKIES